ncbi:heptaprenyl diphosphate synthase component 1 [Bacillus sp. MUM 13]|uniref:heptaprenyl diphosphate synthase component 1 n=1 Tax=Bacillus sp. MUM 13 TaxID=1678001 RepID=UPI0008F5DE41|nr:heptaprenyl diphosphate synthase component 1 [Bacillus sp. MUM 13]OIK12286.1 hypothetical protein BIV59_09180 [Bacillus sp. MUM 13]
MLNINNLLTKLKGMIESKANHPYLAEFLDKPIIDEDKLLLLWGLFNELDMPEEDKNSSILSAMLMQVALDTHENVTNSVESGESGKVLRTRQLTVLAGDFYSGLYYQILADVENLPLIRILASATKDMNEHKISLYQKTIDETSGLLHSLGVIESSLIYKTADLYKLPHWMELSRSLLLLNRLQSEKDRFLTGGKSLAMEILAKISFSNKDKYSELSKEQRNFLLNKMDHCIIYAQKSAKQAADKLSPASLLKKRVSAILEQTAVAASSFVEEG